MEEMKNVKYLQVEEGQMCINTEWGGFGDDGSLQDILTEFDKRLDSESTNPGNHMHVLLKISFFSVAVPDSKYWTSEKCGYCCIFAAI